MLIEERSSKRKKQMYIKEHDGIYRKQGYEGRKKGRKKFAILISKMNQTAFYLY